MAPVFFFLFIYFYRFWFQVLSSSPEKARLPSNEDILKMFLLLIFVLNAVKKQSPLWGLLQSFIVCFNPAYDYTLQQFMRKIHLCASEVLLTVALLYFELSSSEKKMLKT